MDQDKYLPELMAEKDTLDSTFVHAMRLLAEEIEKYEGDELRKDGDGKKYLDVISNKNIKLSERVLIPVQQYPKFNFVGKLLGPRGNSMKRLQEDTGAKMSILGKGSMRDKGKEEELRKSGEAKYAHLSNDLHVLIEVFAPPGEAYSRMSHALEEIKKFLVPDYNDEIRQEQLRELSYLNGSDDSTRGRTVRGRGLRLATTATSRYVRVRGDSCFQPTSGGKGAKFSTRGGAGRPLPQAEAQRRPEGPALRGAPCQWRLSPGGCRPHAPAPRQRTQDTDPRCCPSRTRHTKTTPTMTAMMESMMMTRATTPTRTTTTTSPRAFQNITNIAMETTMKPTIMRRSGPHPGPASRPRRPGWPEGHTENTPMVDIEGASHR